MNTIVPINIPAWGLIVIPVLLILLMGVLILLTINITNNRQKRTEVKDEKNKNLKEKTLISWIEKKDLTYWLIIIGLGTISVFTFRYKEASEVISHWGFAGTIVSIILAVIAIGFTLFQTLASELSSEKITKSAEKIEAATINLDTVTLVESGKIMKDAADFLRREMEVIKKDIIIIRDETKHNNNKWEEHFKSINPSKVREELISLEDFQNKVFAKLPLYPRVFIFVFFMGIWNNVKINSDFIESFAEKLVNYEIEDSQDTSVEKKIYEEGANVSGLYATYTLIDQLGVLETFGKESKENQKSRIEKLREKLYMSTPYVDLIDQFIKNYYEQ